MWGVLSRPGVPFQKNLSFLAQSIYIICLGWCVVYSYLECVCVCVLFCSVVKEAVIVGCLVACI